MTREHIFNNRTSQWLVALFLFGSLSGDQARPCERGAGPQNVERTSPATLENRGVRFEFIRIPAGEFVMGCDNDDLGKPPHRVRIGYAFEMGRTEVTVAQFRAFVEATGYITDGEKEGSGAIRLGEGDWQSQIGVDWRNPIFPQSDDDPATFISWNDAMAFCRWLSAESGREIRLPSEAEWEYACRAGTTGAYAGELNA
ncbi:MAG: formylglycine-generating enzyme family protein, partial [Solirubrobacterales bacterium]